MSFSWLWWPVDKVIRLLVDMTSLLRRNLTLIGSTLWRRSIEPSPPPPSAPQSSSSTRFGGGIPNKKDYMCIDMEPREEEVQKILSCKTEGTDMTLTLVKEDIPVALDPADIATLKRGFTSASTSSPSSSPFPSEQGRSGLHSKRVKLTFDDRKEKRLKSKEKRKSKMESINDRTAEQQCGQNKEDTRPNHFVAFRISNSEVLENIKKVQDRMLSRPVTSLTNCKSGHVFKETLVSVHKLHFTLHVMQLQNEEQVSKAAEVLQAVFDRVKENFTQNPLNIPIQGMGHFRNSVLFAKIHGDESIHRVEALSTLVRSEFEAVGFHGDAKSFKPHMTIAKMSKAKKLYKKKIRSFPRDIWEQDEHTPFGHQNLEGIELLSMMETDPVTKYYKCVAQFQF